MWDLTTALELFAKGENGGGLAPSHSTVGPASLSAVPTAAASGSPAVTSRPGPPPRPAEDGGPTAEELVRLLDHVELSAAGAASVSSRTSTPACISPSPSLAASSSHHYHSLGRRSPARAAAPPPELVEEATYEDL